MYTELFFDDYRLFGREGTKRKYGRPELIATYTDANFSSDYPSPFVLERDGKYIMLYIGKHRESKAGALLAAISDDGVDFTPLNIGDIGIDGRLAENEVMPLKNGQEPLAIIEYPEGGDDERYIMIMTEAEYRTRYVVFSYVMTSPDLVHWHRRDGELPGFTCEPIGGAFHNASKNCYTVIHRSTWGTRDVGYADTKDFRTFTDHEVCLHQDALDAPLDELYGMPTFAYGGMYIGLLSVYADNAPSRCVKYDSGNIYPQLAYSSDGHHFTRSLRTSFLPEYKGQPSVFWLYSMKERANDILLYAAHSDEPHGRCFSENKTGRISIYSLRRDGFICLSADENTATVTTREYIYGGGEININISAKHATAAIIDTTSDENDNILAKGHVVPGFDHCDCDGFSGDSTCWHPKFAGGPIDVFTGKTVLVEVRYSGGELYSVSGDLTPIGNTDAARYRLRRAGKIK